MLKRTKGRLLLTLLVTTGLAGTLKHTSLTSQERKFAINLIKDSKTEVLNNIEGLSDEQLNFKPSKDSWSIGKLGSQMISSENDLWALLETTMKNPANPEKRADVKFSDEELVKMMEDCCNDAKPDEAPSKIKSGYIDKILSDFKTKRVAHIKYIKSSTEDLRNHVLQMSYGWIDCYQLSLVIAASSNRYARQVNEIKNNPRFPK